MVPSEQASFLFLDYPVIHAFVRPIFVYINRSANIICGEASSITAFFPSYHHVLSRAHLFPPNSGLPKGPYSLSEPEERV